MAARSTWRLLGSLVLLLQAAAGLASEVSERLVARGEVAYADGRWDEARGHFAAALAADPADASAAYGLGLAAARGADWPAARAALERALAIDPGFAAARRALEVARRSELAAEPRDPGAPLAAVAGKRWALRAGTGIQYDTNVRADPADARDDVAFLFRAGARYDVWRDARSLVRLDYDLYQSLHAHEDDFDLRGNRIHGTVSRALVERLWFGVQGGFDHYVLGDHTYLREPWVLPYLSLLEGTWGQTQLLWRHGELDYLGRPFDDVRDGARDAADLTQRVFIGGRGGSVAAGYQYEEENPDAGPGRDFARRTHAPHVDLLLPAWWQTEVELGYVFRYDAYKERNSAAGFRKRRLDRGHDLLAAVRRPFGRHVQVALTWYGTLNPSNVALYDYDRHIVAAEVQLAY
jgi:hypothetical protein